MVGLFHLHRSAQDYPPHAPLPHHAADAFKWAAAADPTAKLCINDFSLIEADAGPKLVKLINDHLVPAGAPIHCIGIQAHFEEYGINTTKQQQGLDLLASTGLDLWITEFSLFSTWTGPGNKPISYLDEDTQASTAGPPDTCQ